jgi:adenylate cyclase
MPSKKFYWIEFIGDRSLKIEEGQSILHASLAAGIPHYHACGGNAKCSTCRVLVKAGQEFLSPCNEKEKQLRTTIPFPSNVRLACQTFVTGSPVKVHRIIRDETDIHLYIDGDTATDVQNIGAEMELALFFLDIRDFTPFMENALAFDVIHVMRRLFGLFRKCIELYSGRIIETVGDGLYAVFGFSENIQTAANNASKAGLAILRELENFNEQYLERNFNHSFQVGIGLHVGNVIVGNIGIGVNNNLTVMGLAVNIASRLQAATKQLNNSFLVSEEVYGLLSDPPKSTQKQIELKGLKEDFVVHLIGKEYGK